MAVPQAAALPTPVAVEPSTIASANTAVDTANATGFCRPTQLFAETVDEEFLCPHGGGALVNPHRPNGCDHEFCFGCLHQHFEGTKGDDGTAKCPEAECHVRYNMGTVRRAPKTARLLDRLVAFCDNRELGCLWEGPWGSLANHRNQNCVEETVKCCFAGCSEQMLRKQYYAHKEQCDFRSVKCQFCLRLYKFCDVEYHGTQCGLRVIPCSQHCGREVQRQFMDSHVDNDCPETVVSCPYATYGCPVQDVRRARLHDHLTSSMMTHIDIVTRELIAEKQRYQRDVQQMREKLDAHNETVQKEFVDEGQALAASLAQLRVQVSEQQATISRFTAGSTIVVDENGFGLFKTIVDALAACCEGDTIIVRPGTYREPLVVKKPGVMVRGAEVDSVIVEPTDGVAVCITESASVCRLTIKQQSKLFPAVRIEGGSPTLYQCKVSSVNASCVVVTGGTPKLAKCEILGSQRFGIDWRTTASSIVSLSGLDSGAEDPQNIDRVNCGGAIVDCIVRSSVEQNIAVGPGANPFILRCDIHSSSHNGVMFRESSRGTLQECKIHNNGYSNVDVMAAAEPNIEACEIFESKKCGVCFAEGASGALTGSFIHDNEFSNVAVLAESTPLIIKNEISRAHQHGLLCKSGSRAIVRTNSFHTNAFNNVFVEEGSQCQVSDQHLQ